MAGSLAFTGVTVLVKIFLWKRIQEKKSFGSFAAGASEGKLFSQPIIIFYFSAKVGAIRAQRWRVP